MSLTGVYHTRKGKMFYLGNALLDISAECDSSILEKYKLKADDNSEYGHEQVGLFEELCNKSVMLTPGGSAQNSARISQWLLQGLGSKTVAFTGCIGNDSYGRLLEEKLKASQVITEYQYHPSLPTGVSAGIVTSDGKRTLCARLGAAEQFSPEHLKCERVKRVLQKAEYVYVEGFFLSHSPGVVYDLAKNTHENNKKFVLNLSATYICECNFSDIMNCMPYIDLLFGNDSEARAFGHHLNLTITSVSDIAKQIALLPKMDSDSPRVVVITRGTEPLIVAQSSSSQCLEYPVPRVAKIGDTIGAGDSFVAGFLSALLFDATLEEAVKCGLYAASEIVKQRGCTLPDSPPDASVFNFVSKL
ncbi:adenosine kinase-like isoform X1 [Limulus polyphemus]|uniref:Adenosine kinase n=2 Tax=Limulus polyphemus TaxID=6850 RepID=A0ABM1TKF1_LIMPO|nr:adenosine kinase-like isoform X1 [Limulus polyphemus]